ncbi:potassium channel family protein [Tolypothrix sp. VBCCA 56010]|uniref:potassium channel family protein n=1 Tax=Tolypothrix sp. VBCCA 56010 TaxID=3137731 RepID=UPI003D7E12CF
MAICEAIVGILIIVIVAFDVFQVVIVPRRSPRTFRISALLIRLFWFPWRQLSLHVGKRQEYLFGIFAPLSLMLLLTVWVIALIVGYGLILYALQDSIQPAIRDFGTALYLAGTSLFTLGFGDFVGIGMARVVMLAAAGSGLAVMSLVIAFLFSLYSSLQHREVFVNLIEARAGSPPSGVTLLETYTRLKILDQLPRDIGDWEVWAAEILESHCAYPILSFFRSTLKDDSWISTLGAMLDACTLLLTTVETEHSGRAYLMHRMGCRIVLDLHRLFQLPLADILEVDREQFEQSRASLAQAGFVLQDAESAWLAFVEMHSAYSSLLNTLVQYFATTPPLWTHHNVPAPHPLARRFRNKTASRWRL